MLTNRSTLRRGLKLRFESDFQLQRLEYVRPLRWIASSWPDGCNWSQRTTLNVCCTFSGICCWRPCPCALSRGRKIHMCAQSCYAKTTRFTLISQARVETAPCLQLSCPQFDPVIACSVRDWISAFQTGSKAK